MVGWHHRLNGHEWASSRSWWWTGKPAAAAAAAKLPQSCLTLCNPIDSSPPGSTIPGILQARTLEWVAISFSNAWKWSHSIVSDPQWPHGLQPSRLLRPWDFPGKSTGVGCHCLLRQGSLVCCNSWGRKESDTTEWLNWTAVRGTVWSSCS